MKNFIKDIKTKKIAFAAVALLVILTVGATMAYYAAETGVVRNFFKAGEISTEVDEVTEGLKKELVVKNTGASACLVRIRVTATPEQYLQLKAGNPVIDPDGRWMDGGDGFWYYAAVLPSQGSTDNEDGSKSFTVEYETTDAFSKLDKSEQSAILAEMNVTVYQEAVQASIDGISATNPDGSYNHANALQIWEKYNTEQQNTAE